MVNVLFLNGPVESFRVRIHFRAFGIGVPVNGMEPAYLRVKMFCKFRAIVREDVVKTERKQESDEVKELLRGAAGMARRCPGQREAGVDIRKRNYVSPQPVQMFFNGVKGSAVSRMFCLELFGFSGSFRPFPRYDGAVMADFLGHGAQAPHVPDEIADCGH